MLAGIMPRPAFLVAAFVFTSAVVMTAQAPQGVPENSVTKVSDHVSAIIGFPNIGIIVGSRATLVVDTGMGRQNGAVVVKEAAKLAKGPMLYLTTTHFHPEHAGGEQAFPEHTVLIRPAVQQAEMEKRGMEFVNMFSSRSEVNRKLLEGVTFRQPDIMFDHELKLDLGGGVSARLLWLGPAHTQGDELIFVEPDSVLVPGDIVQSKLVPNMPSPEASPKSWLAILDKLEALHPRYIVPDHGALGDGSLIAGERALISEIQRRSLELKRQGVSKEDAGKQVAAELKAKYPDLGGVNSIPNAVSHVYAEAQ